MIQYGYTIRRRDHWNDYHYLYRWLPLTFLDMTLGPMLGSGNQHQRHVWALSHSQWQHHAFQGCDPREKNRKRRFVPGGYQTGPQITPYDFHDFCSSKIQQSMMILDTHPPSPRRQWWFHGIPLFLLKCTTSRNVLVLAFPRFNDPYWMIRITCLKRLVCHL